MLFRSDLRTWTTRAFGWVFASAISQHRALPMYYDQYNRIDPSHEASYGDWGTSKTYVRISLGISGYSSFSLIAAICLLTALVGVNYMAICRHYPRTGGGVYASVRHRSEILSIVGAFLLIAGRRSPPCSLPSNIWA